MKPITPCLWFDRNAEEAANFYVSVFRDSKITSISRYPDIENPGGPGGSVMTVSFELGGRPFLAMNAGTHFKIDEAVSFMIPCRDQAEVDYYFEKLCAHPESAQCGWVKDKFGVSWQLIPHNLETLITNTDPATHERVMKAIWSMKKTDLAAIEKAAKG